MEKQGSKEWLNKRVGRVTGSIAGAILDVSKFKTRKQVLRDMVRAYHGMPSEFKDNNITQYGKHAEKHAVGMFEMKTGLDTEECGFFEKDEWLGASPDRLIPEMGAVLEIKCPYGKFGTAEFSEILPEYYAQIQLEMYCAGVDACYFMQWSPQGYHISSFLSSREWLDENLPKLRDFWENEFLREIHNPAHLEPLRKTIDSEHALHLADEYTDLGAMEKSIEARKKEILAELVDLAGNKNAVVGGHKLTEVERDGGTDYKKAVEKYCPDADLAPFKKKSSKYWRLS